MLKRIERSVTIRVLQECALLLTRVDISIIYSVQRCCIPFAFLRVASIVHIYGSQICLCLSVEEAYFIDSQYVSDLDNPEFKLKGIRLGTTTRNQCVWWDTC
jgi:hypothetical protein